jgi:hypothetical protein
MVRSLSSSIGADAPGKPFSSGVPQSTQKRTSGSFAVPQFGQFKFTPYSLYEFDWLTMPIIVPE